MSGDWICGSGSGVSGGGGGGAMLGKHYGDHMGNMNMQGGVCNMNNYASRQVFTIVTHYILRTCLWLCVIYYVSKCKI